MKLIFLISIYVLALSLNGVSEALQVVTMDSYKTQITLDSTLWSSSSRILKSHSIGSYPTGMNKTLNFVAPFGSAIVASIRLLDLRPHCVDKLTLFDTTNRYLATMYCNTWGTAKREEDRYETKTFYVTSGKLSVNYMTDRNGNTFFYDGFQLTVTAVNSLPCKSYEYRCYNSRCIANDLKCDGHNHCGDGSGNSNCSNFTVGRTVGIVIGSIFLVIGIIMALVYGLRRYNSGITTETIVTSHPPPVNPPPPYTTTTNNPSAYPTAVYPPPAYTTTYPQGYSNPSYR